MQAQNPREVKGEAIANEMGVRRVAEDYYRVKSQTRPREYDVRLGEYGWICSCDDSYYRGSKCKDVWAVEFSFQLREAVKAIVPTVIKALGLSCKFCGSEGIKKDARRSRGDSD